MCLTPLSFRHLEEMTEERGVVLDHATIHRWAIKIVPVLAAVFRRRKRPVGKSWRMDETSIITGIETMHMIRQGQIDCHDGEVLSAANQFYSLAF